MRPLRSPCQRECVSARQMDRFSMYCVALVTASICAFDGAPERYFGRCALSCFAATVWPKKLSEYQSGRSGASAISFAIR